MNNWGYLILIAALIVLTAFMLYARFAARSREKSLHHAPSELGELRFEEVVKTPGTPEESCQTTPDPVAMDLKAVRNEADEAEAKKKASKGEDTYFDELQEAAAGLAMLMRSSPSQERPEPVVFEPEGHELEEVGSSSPVVDDEIIVSDSIEGEAEAEVRDVVSEEVGAEESETPEEFVAQEIPDAEIDEEDAPLESGGAAAEENPSITEAMDHVEALLDGPPVFDEGEVEAFNQVAEQAVEEQANVMTGSLEARLGGEVASQLLAIDSGLDELESLVVSIEDQLALLEDFISAPLEDEISEAA